MQKKQKSNTLLIVIVLIVLCCLLLACIVGYLWYTGNSMLNQFGIIPVQQQGLASSGGVHATGASPVLYLAGRTDITIPLLGKSSDVIIFSCRDSSVVQETFPPGYRITAGTEFTFSAQGLINYYGGPKEQGFPPDGDENTMAGINSFGGISAYQGPAGALAGVFLTDAIPLEPAPEPINFMTDGTGIEFTRLEPQIGQVFFIGDGVNGAGAQQAFTAPVGATRLFIGLVDGSGFYGDPTCYADNVGSYDYEVNANQPFEAIP